MDITQIEDNFSNLISLIALSEGVCGLNCDIRKEEDDEISLATGVGESRLFLSCISDGLEVETGKRSKFKADYYKDALAQSLRTAQIDQPNKSFRYLNNAIASRMTDAKYRNESLKCCFNRLSEELINAANNPNCPAEAAILIANRLTSLGINISPSIDKEDSIPNITKQAVEMDKQYTPEQKEAIYKHIDSECDKISKFCLVKRKLKAL